MKIGKWENFYVPSSLKILSDYTLPKFRAPQALETLKTNGLDIPFIIISGTIGEETAVAALKAGANDFLIKGKYTRPGPAIERELRETESRRERRRAEERNKYHARLLRHLNDAVIAIDNQFRVTAWNRAAERIYGWTAAEVMGRIVDEVLRFGLSQEDQEKAQEFLRQESSYRPAWSAEDALAYIREQSGKHFHPQVVEAFLKMIE